MSLFGLLVLACALARPAACVQHSGYLSVATPRAELEVFYAHVEHPDASLPLIVWMNGGPGASSLTGFFTELGPNLLNSRGAPEPRSGSNWTLEHNPWAWSTLGSLLVWEQPAGVGFSRCAGGRDCEFGWDDDSAADANLATLRAFYGAHPSAASRDLYIAGESYAGIYVPMLATRVLAHNHARAKSPIRLRGVMVGNGCIGYGVSGGCGTDALDLFVTTLERAAVGVSRGLLAAARTRCDGELESGKSVAELSAPCAAAMRDLSEEVGAYNVYHWASPCGPDGQGDWGDGRGFACAGDLLSTYLADRHVQSALGVISPNEPTRRWMQWDGTMPKYNITLADAQPAYRELLASGVRVLVYNGLADTGVPAVGAEKWVPRVGGHVAHARRKWGAPPDGRFAGYATTYTAGLTFVTVDGAGHLVPADRPQAAHAMVSAFLSAEPMPTYRGATCTPLWLGRGWGDLCPSSERRVD